MSMLDKQKPDPSTIRRLRVSDVLSIDVADDATQEQRDGAARTIRVLRAYFRRFAFVPLQDEANVLDGGERCLSCGSWLSGFLGSFRYGLAHGEGSCSNCGWPVRTHHYPEDDDGEQVLTLVRYPLQYHPDEVTRHEPV